MCRNIKSVIATGRTLIFFRLHLVQVITEHNRFVKVLVISMPPIGKKNVGQYIES